MRGARTLPVAHETINRVVSLTARSVGPAGDTRRSFDPPQPHPMTIILVTFGVLLVLVVLMALWAVGLYNGLVTLRNRFKNAFAQIDVQLTRRYDLIPNLVETAKGYLKHESGTLEAVIKARNIAAAAAQTAAADPADANALRGLVSAETGLVGALSRLMVVSEAYPELKASQNMMQVTEELTSTENKAPRPLHQQRRPPRRRRWTPPATTPMRPRRRPPWSPAPSDRLQNGASPCAEGVPAQRAQPQPRHQGRSCQ